MTKIFIKLRRVVLRFYIYFVKFLLKDFLLKVFLLLSIKKRYKDYVYYNFIDNNDKIYKLKNSNNKTLSFFSRSLMTEKRYETFFTKEPDTIEWINNFRENSIFYDIGANVGIYSIYASSLTRNINVVAFEPSVFNIEILSKNIFINNMHENISIFPLALDIKKSQNQFNMSSIEPGGALSGFGTDLDEYNNKRNIEFKYKTFSMNLDNFILDYNLNSPNYIKIDVDGLELNILKGATGILKNKKLYSILIENSNPLSNISNFLKDNNFILKSQHKNNQIWEKAN